MYIYELELSSTTGRQYRMDGCGDGSAVLYARYPGM